MVHQFQTLGQAEKLPPRVDYYLQLVGEPAMGIKFRDGRLEIKRRIAEYGEVQIQHETAGVLEGWRKWSLILDAHDVALDESGNDISPWLPIRKTRLLLRFAVVGDRRFLFPGPLRPERGCEIELTGVDVGARQWWTLALEAYGPNSSVKADLMAIARQFFEGEAAPSLEAIDSYGYPEWLGCLSGFLGE